MVTLLFDCVCCRHERRKGELPIAFNSVPQKHYLHSPFSSFLSLRQVHVFDLAENKHEPLCEQKVVKRAKLTHVCFNYNEPIIIVGDDRGGVNSLKLSPNLRKIHEPRGEDGEVLPHDKIQLQVEKMEKLLSGSR